MTPKISFVVTNRRTMIRFEGADPERLLESIPTPETSDLRDWISNGYLEVLSDGDLLLTAPLFASAQPGPGGGLALHPHFRLHYQHQIAGFPAQRR